MALNQIRKLAQDKNYAADKMMQKFSIKVDQEILELKLRPLVSE